MKNTPHSLCQRQSCLFKSIQYVLWHLVQYDVYPQIAICMSS